MSVTDDPGDVYRAIGVKPIISASGSTTAYGGSKLRPEVTEAMNKASAVMVELDELNLMAGRKIAELTGADAGLVTSGSGGGLVLQAAAVIAGADPNKMAQLPDTVGLKNEIIMHKSHRFPYDQLYRAAGARIVEFGDGRRCHPWQLEGAFTERTVAVAYLFAPFVSRSSLSLGQVCEIAHARGVPVIVDAASFIPPRANLKRFISGGADMVVYSGGKGVRGPQGTGFLCGRADLVEAAFANASPHQFLGRGMKVAKEEIVGLLAALQIFVDEDENSEITYYRQKCQRVMDALFEIPGLNISVRHDEYDYLIPSTVIEFTRDWKGPSRDSVVAGLAYGDPPIFLHTHGHPNEPAIDPLNLSDDEVEIVISRLREELLRGVR